MTDSIETSEQEAEAWTGKLQPSEAGAHADVVAMRFDFDGDGYRYIDGGSGSDWRTRHADAEGLVPAGMVEGLERRIAELQMENARLLGELESFESSRHAVTQAGHPAAVEEAEPRTLRQQLQQQCSDWGTYWRASDSHGVELSMPQAVELLENALGVEVEIKHNGCTTCDGNGMIGGPSYYSPDEGGVPCPDCATPRASTDEAAGVPKTGCELGCTEVCKAKEHGCASECPALPWQPSAPPTVDTSHEREAFEAAAREEWDGKSIPDAAWIGWKLRAALSSTPAAVPADSQVMMYLALTDAMGYDSGKDGIEFSPEEWAANLLRDALAHRAALSSTPATVPQDVGVPEGWKLVPVKATTAMINAGQCGCMDNDVTVCVWDSMLAATPNPPTATVQLIDMVLFCPSCGRQHIDASEPNDAELDSGLQNGWGNPPHRSHLCHSCGCIWRPADVPTNGVAAIKTQGQRDTWVGKTPFAAPATVQADPTPDREDAERWREWLKGKTLTVIVPTPTDKNPASKTTVIYGPNPYAGFAAAMNTAIDAARASAAPGDSK